MGAQGNDDASSEIGHMDEKWKLLRDLYHKKYKGFNPIYHDNDRKMLDPPMQELAQRVKALIETHGEHFLVLHAGALTQGQAYFLNLAEGLGHLRLPANPTPLG